MKSKFGYLKIWASAGALASLAWHLWRCQGQVFFWEGTSSLKPAIDFVMTPYPLLAIVFWKARSAKVLTFATVLFFILMPEFRVQREREIRRALATMPADAKAARPQLAAAMERFPEAASLRLLKAELEIAEGNLPATKAALDSFETWPEDLLPRVGHLRYVLYRARLTSDPFLEIIP